MPECDRPDSTRPSLEEPAPRFDSFEIIKVHGLPPGDEFFEIQQDAADADPACGLGGVCPFHSDGGQSLDRLALTAKNFLLLVMVIEQALFLAGGGCARKRQLECVLDAVGDASLLLAQDAIGQSLGS